MNNPKDPNDTSNDARSINFDGPSKVIKVPGRQCTCEFKTDDMGTPRIKICAACEARK